MERVDWAEIEGEPYFYEMDNIEKVSIEELKKIGTKNDKRLEEMYEMDLQLTKLNERLNEMSEKDKEKFMLQVLDKMNSLDLDLSCDEMDAEDKEFLEAAALFYNNNKEAYERDVKNCEVKNGD